MADAISPCEVQLRFSEKPSIIFKFKEGIVKFINESNGGKSSDKHVLEKMADDYSMRIIETDMYDEDRVGFERSASAVSLICLSSARQAHTHTQQLSL